MKRIKSETASKILQKKWKPHNTFAYHFNTVFTQLAIGKTFWVYKVCG